MNKNDLIQKLADHTGLPKNDAAKAVDGVFDLIAASLKAGEEVRLTGFGVFVVATRAGGKGRNPQTGEEITIKPSKQPRFRAGKQLKEFAQLRRLSFASEVRRTCSRARRRSARSSCLGRKILRASYLSFISGPARGRGRGKAERRSG